MFKVFVYGTLKEGFPNFKSNKGKRGSGEFVTKEKYPFYLVGERYAPWLINSPGLGKNVLGQVFEVDDKALKEMDVLERISKPDGNRRVMISVRNTQSSDEIAVFIYMKQPDLLDQNEVKLGPLNRYESEHAKMYRSRNLLQNNRILSRTFSKSFFS